MSAKTVIQIPKIDVNAPVVEIFLSNESWDVSPLNDSVGRLEGTADFSSQDNVVVTGYSLKEDGEPGIFAKLNLLSQGDEVLVTQDGKEHRFTVTEARKVRYDDFTVLDTSWGSR